MKGLKYRLLFVALGFVSFVVMPALHDVFFHNPQPMTREEACIEFCETDQKVSLLRSTGHATLPTPLGL